VRKNTMAEALLQTTVVGSYPQPDWLVNRDRARA
jgi:methionine synthase II (cobalamin-independent)